MLQTLFFQCYLMLSLFSLFRCNISDVPSKKMKNKKLDNRKSKDSNSADPEFIKTASQLQQRLAIPNLTIKKVPYKTHTLQSELSGQTNKEDKLILSGASNSNTILNQLQTAGLQVTSKVSMKTGQKKDRSKEKFPCQECSSVLSSKRMYNSKIVLQNYCFFFYFLLYCSTLRLSYDETSRKSNSVYL